MRYNVIGYLIKEGFKNTFKNKKSTFAALGIMICTMIVFGGFFAISENIDNMLTQLEQSQGIQVFINLDVPQSEVEAIEKRIHELEGVNSVQYVSQSDALETMKGVFENHEELLEGAGEIFPVSYVVTFTDLEKNYEIQKEINTWEGIKRITNKDDTTNALMKIGNGIRIVSAVILVFLVAVSIFIISNTIKLTVHARRKEISIMKYVGATNGFIRWPFVVEGVIIGIVSALVSFVVIGLGYNAIAEQLMASTLMEKLEFMPVSFTEMINLIIIVYAILGVGIGVIGSMISMKKYLEV